MFSEIQHYRVYSNTIICNVISSQKDSREFERVVDSGLKFDWGYLRVEI